MLPVIGLPLACAGSSFNTGSGMNGMGHSGSSSFNTGGLTTRSAGYDIASSGLSPADLGPQLTNLNSAMQQHLAALASAQVCHTAHTLGHSRGGHCMRTLDFCLLPVLDTGYRIEPFDVGVRVLADQ